MKGTNLSYEQRAWVDRNSLSSDDFHTFDLESTVALRNRWLSRFLPNLDSSFHRCPACSKETTRSYYWHAFSFGRVEASEVDLDIFRQKLRSITDKLYLLWEECNSVALLVDARILSDCNWKDCDIYVFDIACSWTFAVTHEGWVYSRELGNVGAMSSSLTRDVADTVLNRSTGN